MTPERWQQVRQIFEDALERPPAERSAFVRAACGDEGALQREVEAMLAAHDSDSDFLAAPPHQLAADAFAAQPVSLPTLSAGQRLAHYEIHSLLGKGGMGEVYLAQDLRLRRKVALKVLPEHFTTDAERLRRFKQEGLAVSALNHPNIVTIHEIGQADGHAQGASYIVTEFVEGQTLRQRLADGRLTPGEAIGVALQTAAALAAAHAAGITHRDIKPENIMLRPDGYVKVLDFGLAKLAERGAGDAEMDVSSLESTALGRVMGTWRYMSPEQARGLKVDARTDIFSLGAMLYEMVSGQAPFRGETTADVIAAILEREPEPLPQHTPATPPALTQIVNKTLRKDRETRYQDVRDLLNDLQILKEALTVESRLTRAGRPGTDAGRAPAGTASDSATARTATGDALPPMASRLLHAVRTRVAVSAIAALVCMAAVAAYVINSARSGSPVIKAIAVLPFTNGSGDQALDYLSDGLTESLIDRLARLPQLKVIARASSFRYKGREPPLEEVASALGVEAVITGRVVQRGGSLVVRAELVNARDQTQLWSATYERKATDLLLVQAEISAVIVEKLRVQLTAGTRRQLARQGTAVPQAYDFLLSGRFYANQGGQENQQKAGEYFQQAIKIDPAYALPYVELAFTYRSLMTNSTLDPKKLTANAEDAVRRALALDEDLPEAHAASAEIQRNGWNWAAAEREFARAIELNPNYARARSGYAMFLVMRGRAEQAIAEIARAQALDPLSLQINNAALSILYFARRHDEAIDAARKLVELDRTFAHGHIQLGYNYAGKRMYPEAIAEYLEGIRLGNNDAGAQIYLGAAYALNGERAPAQALLQRLETLPDYVSPGELAILYGALGQRDQAFAALERAYAAHDLQLQFLGVDLAFDSLRADPRFTDLLRRVGLRP